MDQSWDFQWTAANEVLEKRLSYKKRTYFTRCWESLACLTEQGTWRLLHVNMLKELASGKREKFLKGQGVLDWGELGRLFCSN